MPSPIVEYHAALESGVTKWTYVDRASFSLGSGFGGVDPEPPLAPNPPRNMVAVKSPTSPTSQINVTWAAPLVDGTHDPQTGYRVYTNGVQVGGNLASTATSYTITNLTPGITYAVTMRAFNAAGTSAATTAQNVTLEGTSVSSTMLMGCSASDQDHGGTEDWDVWRCYTESKMLNLANRTGSQRPIALAYSKQGANLGGANPNYTTVYNEVLGDLNSFYYNGTGNTRSSRWGIRLYWSNGNENFDKGALTLPHTAAGIAAFTTSQRALYDAVHLTVDGVRRFPDAYAGSNPTHSSEHKGEVEAWLHPSARYHDFVMWSAYPPGRDETPFDPTYDWPGLTEADRTNRTQGYMARCFYRTRTAEEAARAATGNPGFTLILGIGEIGIADDPDDQNSRPYWACHAAAAGLQKWASRSGREVAFACWWDNQVAADTFPSTLSDEPGATNPSTRMAWQNWRQYNHEFGGTHPAAWAGKPGNIGKKRGPIV